MMKHNRILIRFSALFLLAFSVFLVGCEDDVASDNDVSNSFVGFSFDQYLDVPIGETVSYEAKVYASESKGTDRTITLYVDDASTADPSQYAVPSSVTIPAGEKEGTINFSVTGGELGSSGKTIILGMEPQEGMDMPTTYTGSAEEEDLMVMQRQLVITAKDLCLDNSVTIEVTLDPWPEEVYWAIVDDGSGTVVAENGPYSTYNNAYAGLSGTITTVLCLPDGSYTFYIFDDYGDGAGAVSITSNGTVLFATDGVYGSGTSGSFSF